MSEYHRFEIYNNKILMDGYPLKYVAGVQFSSTPSEEAIIRLDIITDKVSFTGNVELDLNNLLDIKKEEIDG